MQASSSRKCFPFESLKINQEAALSTFSVALKKKKRLSSCHVIENRCELTSLSSSSSGGSLAESVLDWPLPAMRSLEPIFFSARSLLPVALAPSKLARGSGVARVRLPLLSGTELLTSLTSSELFESELASMSLDECVDDLDD